MLSVLIAAGTIMLASLAGVFSVWQRFGDIIERNLSYLVSFSAGVFLLVSYKLAEEALAHAPTPLSGTLFIALGVGASLLLFRILPAFHHHHDEQQHEAPHTRLDARRILLSDGIHNIGDGLLIASSFAVSMPLGIAATASIFVHELVQEVSEFFVLRQAGFSTHKALLLNFLLSGTILIGAIVGHVVLGSADALHAPILGIAAGAFIVVVAFDLIPHSVRASKMPTHYLHHTLWFIGGIILMFGINTFLGH